MRCTWLVVLVGACGFDHGAATVARDGDADSAELTDGEIAIDSMQPPSPFCDSAGGTLVACYEFENTGQDGSGHNLNATTANVTFPSGKVGKALQLAANGAADVAESPILDVSAVTIEAWIRVTQMPATGLRAGILDNNSQYGFFLHDSGRIQCTVGNMTVARDGIIATDTWTHVACTYDGTDSALYVDGRLAATTSGGTALSTAGTTGISIAADNPPGAGSRLAGQIDQLRIFNVARASTQICLAAEGDDCL